MLGDQSRLTRADQVERLWEVSASVREHPLPVEPSAPGPWGPPSIGTVVAPHRWPLPEED
jgi:glucose-6-phosphate 1-dehydrogenase